MRLQINNYILEGNVLYDKEHQEWLIITNSKEKLDNRPVWQQVALDY